MAQRYPDVTFAKVDADECETLARKYGIRALPTFVFFTKGSKVASVQGANESEVVAAIDANKPIGGTTLSWGGDSPAGAAPSSSPVASSSMLLPYSALDAELKSRADNVMTVTACTASVAAAMVQKHKGDADAATMEILTSLAGAEAFASEHIPAEGAGAPVRAAPVPTGGLSSTAGEAGEGAAVPNASGGAALQFRMASKASIKIKETFDKAATVGAVSAWLKTRLPAGCPFSLRTRKGASEVPLDASATLEGSGLSPRGLVLVADCPAVAFL